MKNRINSIVVAIILVVTLCSILSACKCSKGNTVNIGDVVTFGPYEWIVLTMDGNNALLITKEAIACKKFHERLTEVTWRECTLRSWLNTSFLDEFSSAEQSKILTTTVSNPSTPNTDKKNEDATSDKVFLLSIYEAGTYFGSDAARICYPNETAKAQGTYSYPNGV